MDQLFGNHQPLEQAARMFMTGNEVVVWGALAAGADYLFGYPITPQNEIMHYWARLAPRYHKGFLQTEDELSAGFAMLGGALVGRKTFSATAGPGNVLMQEPISMAEMMRLPGVWIVQQRGGPSTATVIYSQQELRLTTLGGNGEGMRIVYSTASHQDLFDYTIKAFQAAWKYRFPAFVLGDGYQAKMREPVTIYPLPDRGISPVPAEPLVRQPGIAARDRPPSHLRNTFNIEEELFETLTEHWKDYQRIAPEILEWETDWQPDTEVLIIAHGIVARAAKEAVLNLRKQGIRAGYFRPITVRPFPEAALTKLVSQNPGMQLWVVESAQGQLLSLVKESLYSLTNPIESFLRPGIGITAEAITDQIAAKYVVLI